MPVKVYTSSPIRASAADGTTPPTQTAAHEAEAKADADQTPTATPTTATPTSPATTTAPPPQPGARPSLPAKTSAAAAPEAPPPQAGMAAAPSYPHAAPLNYPMTTSAAPPAYMPSPGAAWYPRQTGQDGGEARNYMHPPGYQQNVHAAELSSAQRAAQQASALGGDYSYGDDEGVWGVAKRWASAAGSSIVAAEEEIWRRIMGD